MIDNINIGDILYCNFLYYGSFNTKLDADILKILYFKDNHRINSNGRIARVYDLINNWEYTCYISYNLSYKLYY
jgi:hypothetical protein